MGRVLSETELYNLEKSKRLTPHQIMDLIASAKTEEDFRVIHDNHLQWGRGRHDDTCLWSAFHAQVKMKLGREWCEVSGRMDR